MADDDAMRIGVHGLSKIAMDISSSKSQDFPFHYVVCGTSVKT
jgi:hypothetical protein